MPSFVSSLSISWSCFLDLSRICKAGKWVFFSGLPDGAGQEMVAQASSLHYVCRQKQCFEQRVLFFPPAVSVDLKKYIYIDTCVHTYICNSLQQILLLLCPVNKAIPNNSPIYPVPFFPNHTLSIWRLEMHFQGERGARRVLGSTESTMYSALVTRKQLGQALSVTPKAWM